MDKGGWKITEHRVPEDSFGGNKVFKEFETIAG